MGEQPLTTSVTLRPLGLTNRRAVGGPVSQQLLASYFAVALIGWLAAGKARSRSGRRPIRQGAMLKRGPTKGRSAGPVVGNVT